ncbi:hypothetical protein LTR12_014776 [Friedmanniomyces endolithicus]|nr:hypothetical protein LTR12_014776 [Friedmanniomyces endolithicus]
MFLIKSRIFEEHILAPRGVHIVNKHRVWTPFKHFRTSEVDHLRDTNGLKNAKIWVNKNGAAEIAAEYWAMRDASLPEDKYKAYASSRLLLNEMRSDKFNSQRRARSERMLNPTAISDPDAGCQAPPRPDQPRNDGQSSSELLYSWDLRVDAAYWIQLRALNPIYHHQVRSAVYVLPGQAVTCPYLTSEFKRDGDAEDQARARRQAIAALALYNRWRTYVEAGRDASQDAARDATHIRHYAITFCSHIRSLYVLEMAGGDANDAEYWHGCKMSRLAELDLRWQDEVRAFIKWNQRVSSLGSTRHKIGCKINIKLILQREDVDTRHLADVI